MGLVAASDDLKDRGRKEVSARCERRLERGKGKAWPRGVESLVMILKKQVEAGGRDGGPRGKGVDKG